LVRDQNFDLVISDISMPEMDGYQLLQEIRALASAKDVPALALTGYGRPADFERAQAAGFAEQPLNIDRLLRVIRRLTGGGSV
jgi:two-component system CheB/CheR fusion protein